jgi:hypothetical protein
VSSTLDKFALSIVPRSPSLFEIRHHIFMQYRVNEASFSSYKSVTKDITATFRLIMPSTKVHVDIKCPLEWRWEGFGATGDSLAELSRPGDKLFEEVLDSLDKWKARFKRLQRKKMRQKCGR